MSPAEYIALYRARFEGQAKLPTYVYYCAHCAEIEAKPDWYPGEAWCRLCGRTAQAKPLAIAARLAARRANDLTTKERRAWYAALKGKP